ncbi:hypothetical protein Tco_0112486, partial [Tanacetum coccineum]
MVLAGSHGARGYGATSGTVGARFFWAVTMARGYGSAVPNALRIKGRKDSLLCEIDIISWIQPMAHKRTAKSVIGRLLIAATSYLIWIERNYRIFKNVRRKLKELRDILM